MEGQAKHMINMQESPTRPLIYSIHFYMPPPYYRCTLSTFLCATYMHADECDVDGISGSIKFVVATATQRPLLAKKHSLLGHIHVSWANKPAGG